MEILHIAIFVFLQVIILFLLIKIVKRLLNKNQELLDNKSKIIYVLCVVGLLYLFVKHIMGFIHKFL